MIRQVSERKNSHIKWDDARKSVTNSLRQSIKEQSRAASLIIDNEALKNNEELLYHNSRSSSMRSYVAAP